LDSLQLYQALEGLFLLQQKLLVQPREMHHVVLLGQLREQLLDLPLVLLRQLTVLKMLALSGSPIQ
jgi:hypothetical protein